MATESSTTVRYPRALQHGIAHSSRNCPNRCGHSIRKGSEIVNTERSPGTFRWVCLPCGTLLEAESKVDGVLLPAELVEQIEFYVGVLGSSFYEPDGERLTQSLRMEQCDVESIQESVRVLWDLAGNLEQHRVAQDA